jgi:hypothetical protein
MVMVVGSGTLKLLGTVGLRTILDVDGVVWAFGFVNGLVVERIAVGGYGLPDHAYFRNSSALMMRSDGSVAVGAVDGFGQFQDWTCNAEVGILVDGWTGSGKVFNKHGKLLNCFEEEQWFDDVPWTRGLYDSSCSYGFDGTKWYASYCDFEFTHQVYAGVFSIGSPETTRLVPLAVTELTHYEMQLLDGSSGRYVPCHLSDVMTRVPVPFFILESSGRTTLPSWPNGDRFEFLIFGSVSASQVVDLVFVCDNAGSVVVFDLELVFKKKFEFGCEVVVCRNEARVLVASKEELFEFKDTDFVCIANFGNES